MIMNELLNRIETNPAVLTGKPVIRGTRLSVQYIVGQLAHGATFKEILEEYPYLQENDIYACLAFAEQILENSLFYPLPQSA
ncbi:DUF433 domain-containing protein [Runella rosea]|uniref:DUF433 domain-containing protein n=2 Tax=Runella rosea TaxID=2259595 RepID=A0A344TRT4_9BACT|nr:DUF433 domain-containing protein [Runella rosea]